MPGRILIIEDNPANLDLMVYLLRAFGYTPVLAGNGRLGLELAQQEADGALGPFDLIICDVQLPGMDGYTVAGKLRGTPGYEKTPLLAVTAMAMVGDREKLLAAGFTDHISKPIEPEIFVDRVESFLAPELRAPRVIYPSEEHPAASAPPPRPRLDHSSPLILMVDDVPNNIDFVKTTLEPFGYRLLSAPGVSAGVDVLRNAGERVDMVLCDLHMDPHDGRHFLDLRPELPELEGVPVIIISSTFTTEDECLDCLARGATLFIRRPIEPEALLTEIGRLLPPGNGQLSPPPAS